MRVNEPAKRENEAVAVALGFSLLQVPFVAVALSVLESPPPLCDNVAVAVLGRAVAHNQLSSGSHMVPSISSLSVSFPVFLFVFLSSTFATFSCAT